MSELRTIPARRGIAAPLQKGQQVSVVNIHGTQVVDTWFYNARDLTEFQSNEHTRTALMKMNFQPGDCLYTNQRVAIAEVIEDTTPGVHDMLMSACDKSRYRVLGCTEYHDNCADNLVAAMAALRCEITEVPCPINLFMNIPWTLPGELSWGEPVSVPNDYITFEARMDCIVAFSACPQDMTPINGAARNPVEGYYRIFN